ncbi:MAG TPA: ABC transporter permease [Candidatus Limnocylindrales bacterium]|nr:ABC transporter permease [Candidatus Limnocylindrales bacterium]
MSGLGKALLIARTNLLRQVRERANLFFVFVLPTIIILALGLQFANAGQARLGIVAPAGDAQAGELVAMLSASDDFEIRRPSDAATLREHVERGLVEIGLVIPDGYGADIAAGRPVDLELLGTPESLTAGLRAPIEAAISRQAAISLAARLAAGDQPDRFREALAAAAAGYDAVPGVEVTVRQVGEPGPFAGFGQFSFGAQTQLVLFMFLTSMTAAANLVLTKNLGVSRRMFSTPTSATTIVIGEALGRYGVALMQGIFIIAVTALAFGVEWGDPLATALIVGAFGLVGAAVAMLIGALSRNPDQAGSLGVAAGLGLGALGGAMVPSFMMPPVMLTVAQLTPHYWAINGFTELANGADISAVLGNVGILLAYGTVILLIAAVRFRRAISG